MSLNFAIDDAESNESVRAHHASAGNRISPDSPRGQSPAAAM
jgi:hypothetical protein